MTMIFQCNVMTKGGPKITKELSLLKMYRFVQLDTFFECPMLQWKEDHTRNYKVVEISTIEKSGAGHTTFWKGRTFLKNIFKF